MSATRLTNPSESEPSAEALLERVRARRRLPHASERRQIREGAGVSQRELARALGVSWTAIHRWERGATPRNREAEYSAILDELRRLAA